MINAAAAKRCPGDHFDVGILRGTPWTMLSLRTRQNGRHCSVPHSHTLSLNLLSCPACITHSTMLTFLLLYIPLLLSQIFIYITFPLSVLVHSFTNPFLAAQPITLVPPPSLYPSLPPPFTEPNLFVKSSLGKLCPICSHSFNEYICLCIGHGNISPSSSSSSFSSLPISPYPISIPSHLLVSSHGLYIYQSHFKYLLR